MSDNFPDQINDMLRKVVLGTFKEGTFEQRLTIIGCFTVALVTIVATLANFVTGLYEIGFVTLGLFLLSAFCFLTARFGIFPKWLIHAIFGIAIVFYNMSWYFNFGSSGPTLSIIIGIYVFFILVWKRRNCYLLVTLCAVNLLALFVLEYYFPELIGHYSDAKSRTLDVYLGNGFALILTFIMTFSIKRNYELQYERAKNSDKLKTSFLANLSHEVRTPLNVISGFTSMIPEMNYSDEDLKKIHKVIDYNGRQLVSLIEDIIDLSKLEINQLDLYPAKVNLMAVFQRLKRDFEQYVMVEKDCQIQIRYNVELENPFAWLDEERLGQIIRHLIVNAFRFSDHGLILFGCYEENKKLIFYVKDTGRGIKPEHEDQIFDPFVKFQNRDNTIERGVGMGLHLVKKLVELMGGEIWYKTKYMEGSEFYFSIPQKQIPPNDFS